MTSFTAKDAGGATHEIATQTIASLESFGAFTRALPEGGATPYRFIGLGHTGQVIKAAFGTLYSLMMDNCDDVGSPPVGALDLFVKVYDKATTPTDADVPVMTFKVNAGATREIVWNPGIAFLNGIGLRCTTNVNDSDSTNPPTDAMLINASYN